MVEAPTRQAIELMDAFARRTGLSPPGEPNRYLWTDAFAVLNFLELDRRTDELRFGVLARELIAQVHATLGKHREDDIRSGWLSGLPDELRSQHPTAGGLRIGKPLPERAIHEEPDERLEWDRDGQYFHYLTKWMDALCRAGSMLHEPRYRTWAIELAASCFRHFLQKTSHGVPTGLAWKMSIDLSRPLVPGMSLHDSLDGYVTFRSLGDPASGESPLAEEMRILLGLVQKRDWATSDPLGLGGLLFDACRLAMLTDRSEIENRLIGAILQGVAGG